MNVPVGLALVTPTTERAIIGRFSGDLTEGRLLLTATTTNPGLIEGLAFGVFSLIDDDNNVRVLGDVRYYPKEEGTTLALGYGNLASVSGVVVFEPRAYNLRWIKRSGPGSYWGVAVEAVATSATSVPGYTPAGFVTGAINLTAAAVTGAANQLFAQVQWYE